MLYISTLQLIFIIVAPILGLLLLLFLVTYLFKRYIQNHHFNYYCYQTIYKLVQNNDYYLINNVEFKNSDNKLMKIDHLIFADKYIYVCIDQYYEGDIMGKEQDSSFIMINKGYEKTYIDNPFDVVNKMVRELATKTGIDNNFMIGLMLLNSNCNTHIETLNNRVFVLQINKLNKLIKTIESRNIGNINPEALKNKVDNIAQIKKSLGK